MTMHSPLTNRDQGVSLSRDIWAQFADQAERFQTTMRDRKVLPAADPNQLRARIARTYDFQSPIDAGSLLDDVGDLLANGLVHVTHPRYFGLFNPSVRPISVLGDALTALYNPQLAVWSHAPAACELDRRALAVMKGLIGWEESEGLSSFTTGGAESNLCAVLSALSRAFPEWDEKGLAELRLRPVMYLSADGHHSFVKAARMAGLGTHSVREVPVDSTRRIDLEQLERLMAKDRAEGYHPFLLVGTAGATGTGVIDPLVELREIADRHQLWFHADAAWGGSALMSTTLRVHLRGIERADSVSWDAHKWLSVPMGAGMFFSRHAEATHRAFSINATYMPVAQDAIPQDPFATTPQWSRRGIGLKVFMALAELGLPGYARLIDHQASMGDLLRVRLLEDGWEIVNQTPLPVVCFNRPGVDSAAVIGRLLNRLYEDGQVWISSLALGPDAHVLRACVTSYHTTEEDVAFLVSALNTASTRL